MNAKELKNKYNRLASDASQLQSFGEEVIDMIKDNENHSLPDTNEANKDDILVLDENKNPVWKSQITGTKLYKHSIKFKTDSEYNNLNIITARSTAIELSELCDITKSAKILDDSIITKGHMSTSDYSYPRDIIIGVSYFGKVVFRYIGINNSSQIVQVDISIKSTSTEYEDIVIEYKEV